MKYTADLNYHLETYPLVYTLCFIYRDDDVLMLLRNNPPNRGLWNGVGGHVEKDESPLAGCLREIQEETGFIVNSIKFRGLLTWQGYEVPAGGLYIFTAPAPQYEFIQNDEGTLAWKSRDWVLSAPEVVENIHHFGPYVFLDAIPCIHHFSYENGNILSYDRFQIPQSFNWNQPVRRSY